MANGIIIAEQGTSALIQKVGETIQVELEQSALPLLAKIRNLLEDLQKEADFQVHYSLDGTTWVDAKVLAACETGYLPTLSNQVLPNADFQVFLDKSHEQKQFESQK
ncbi:MAG: hypothetical protein HC892_23545 [Saprospiraceae bacterium]|nr:hypothetical protein [Saprospiraceae bacterium]